MRKSSVMPTRRSEVEVIDANADEWLLAGASGITVSFRPAIPRQVAPQQSPLPFLTAYKFIDYNIFSKQNNTQIILKEENADRTWY